MKQAKSEVFSIESVQDSQEAPKQSNENPSELDPVDRFVRRLMESGCSEELARQSIDHVDQSDIDSCNVTEGNYG